MHYPFDFPSSVVSEFLQVQYALQTTAITLLSQGGDSNAVVYRVNTLNAGCFFLKLRRGVFDESSVIIPRFLADLGIQQIIAPIASIDNHLRTQLADFNAVLYPFVAGQNAFETALTEQQWRNFGTALNTIHAAVLPPDLLPLLPSETCSPSFRERVKSLLEHARQDAFADPIAAQYAGFLTRKAGEIVHFIDRAAMLGAVMKAQKPQFVLCHTDLHAGNLLIDANSSLFIVDWDHPMLAPKERDLMFIGGGVGSAWYQPQEQEYFYQGYGETQINPAALAYYRFERIIQDIAEWGELILLTQAGGKDRERALQGLIRWFSPSDVVAMAYQSEKALPPDLRSPGPACVP